MNNPSQELDKIQMRLVEKFSEVGGWTWDAIRDSIHWSEKAEEILGSKWTNQVRTIREFVDHVQEEDRESIRNIIDRFRQGLIHHGSCTGHISNGSGESRYLMSHIHAEYNDQGILTHLIGTVQDTTAKAQAEKALMENAMKIRLAFDVTPVILFMQDQNYRFTWVKAKSPDTKSRLVGCSDEEVFGADASVEQLRRLKDKALYFNRRMSEEMRLSFWGERRRLYNVIVEPAESVVADEKEIIGAFIDLTEREEKEILERERERVQTTHQARVEFISYLAHEIKTPLNHIIGFADLLKEDICGQEKETVIDHLGLCVQQLRELMEDYLDLAKLDKGRFEVELEPVDLGEMLSELVRSHGLTARKKALVLTSKMEVPPDIVVFIDKQKLRQVLGNLLSNALKYTDCGDVGVSVAWNPTSVRQANLRIQVVDSGPGIPREQRQLIFEPFQRLSHHSALYPGSGLGLAISKRFIEAMGGKIQMLDRADRKGSCFQVDLGVHYYRKSTSVFVEEELTQAKQALLLKGNPSGERLRSAPIQSTF